MFIETAMKYISRWASRHIGWAVLLIIICEIANAVNGLLLGMNLFEGWPMSVLWALMAGMLTGAGFIQNKPVAQMPYLVGRWWLFCAFLVNFLLFFVLGGLCAGQAAITSQPVWGSSRTVIRSDTLAPIDRPRSVGTGDYYVERGAKTDGQVGTRIAFVLLFIASIFVAAFASVLACQLLCAGNGLGVVVFILGMIAPVWGFFFLSLAFERIIKPLKQMSRRDKGRVSLRALLLALGFAAVLTVLSLFAGG